MKRSKLGIGAILILSLLFLFPHHKMEVSFQGNIIYLSDEAFSIEWIHSVEKEEWLEFYERRGDQILLTKTQFKTYGAGVPSSGKSSLTEDGYVEVEINRKMDELRLVVSPRVKSTMHLNDHDLLLYEIVEPYDEVVIKPVSLPVYQYAIYLLKREGLS